MPVRKFRNAEEMNQPRWRQPGSDELLAAIRYVWELGRQTADRRFPPGVHKNRSIEEAQAQREQWLACDLERAASRREEGPETG